MTPEEAAILAEARVRLAAILEEDGTQEPAEPVYPDWKRPCPDCLGVGVIWSGDAGWGRSVRCPFCRGKGQVWLD